MPARDSSLSFYFFDIDDNLLFLPTRLYLWNAETRQELPVSSQEFANVQNDLGRNGKWQPWTTRPEETFRDFRDRAGLAPGDQPFVRDLRSAISGVAVWKGPSWPLLVHAAKNGRPIAVITARGHAPETIKAGLRELVDSGLLVAMPPILGVYSVTNLAVREALGVSDPNMTVPSVKKMAIRDAVEKALRQYGFAPPHRFGMSDDDSNNVVLAISAMRACKKKYPDKRFFVVNTNEYEFVKLEIFPIDDPVTVHTSGAGVLQDHSEDGSSAEKAIAGGNVSVYITDMDRAIEFYVDTLGLGLKTRIKNEWAEIDAGKGFVIGLHPAHSGTPEPGAAGAISIRLAVTRSLQDVVADLVKAKAASGPIVDRPDVRLVSVNDPDGNSIMLVQAR
jgi:catechol 2,3-dioxygenase-like lactoylglutathione lyase family enzyme